MQRAASTASAVLEVPISASAARQPIQTSAAHRVGLTKEKAVNYN